MRRPLHIDAVEKDTNMNQRLETVVQLIAFAASIVTILMIVATSLTLLSTECTRGTPFLPTLFPCFAGQ